MMISSLAISNSCYIGLLTEFLSHFNRKLTLVTSVNTFVNFLCMRSINFYKFASILYRLVRIQNPQTCCKMFSLPMKKYLANMFQLFTRLVQFSPAALGKN